MAREDGQEDRMHLGGQRGVEGGVFLAVPNNCSWFIGFLPPNSLNVTTTHEQRSQSPFDRFRIIRL